MSTPTSPTAIRRQVLVRGRVQGVGFRYSAVAQANRLGLAGFVRNLLDGGVELEVEGEPGSVKRMLEWVATGPPWANVTAIEVVEREPSGETGFTIGA